MSWELVPVFNDVLDESLDHEFGQAAKRHAVDGCAEVFLYGAY